MNIQAICDGINSAIEAVRVPFTYIPAVMLFCSAIQRPGLSAMLIASKIISRQAEAGAPIGPSADGSLSIKEAMERIRVEEMVKALKMDSRIQGAVGIGGIQITMPNGMIGTNVFPVKTDGILN